MPLFHSRTRSFLRNAAAVPFLVALLSVGACLDPDDGETLPAGAAIALEVSQPTATVAVGMSSTTAITIRRINGYTGIVGLNLDSLPAGVTATLDPAALGGAATTSILTLTAVDSAVAKTTTVRLKAAGASINTDSLDLSVTVVKGTLSLTSATTAVTVPQNGSGSVPLSIARANGFAGNVTLIAEGLPANVTATFSPALLTSTSTVSTLTLSALPGAVPANSAVVIRARATGVPDQTVPVQLTIASSTTPGFVLVAAPATFAVVAGSSTQSTITVNKLGGFAGTVTLALSGLPTGVTGVITPVAGSTTTATLALSTTAAAVPGNYTLTLTGSATGQTNRVIQLGLKVTAVPAVTVAVSPTTLRIAPGGFAQVIVLLTRVGGLTGDFTMTAEGLPAGITASFSPSPVIGNVTTLTLSATSAVTTGVYNVVVRAAAGSDFGTATFPLTVGTGSIRN